MKKEYLSPIAEILDVTVESMLAQSGNTGLVPGGSELPGGDPEESNRNRGEWGNVWKK